MINLAIIGTGRMGTYHARLAAAHPHVSIFAFINPSPPAIELKKLAPNAIHANSIEEVINHIDAAIIASPTPTHHAIAHTLLRAGKQVLIEKPVTVDYQQAEELFNYAEQKDCVLHVGHVEQYNPAFIAAKKAINQPIQLVRATRSGPYHPRVGNDSVVLDLMIHDIDLLLRLIGSTPTNIHANGTRRLSTQPDTAIAHISFANGTLASLTVHRGAASSTREMIIEDSKNTLCVDYGTRTLIKKHADNVDVTTPPVGANPLNDQLHAFINAIQSSTHKRNATHDLLTLQTTLTIATQVADTLPLTSKSIAIHPR